MELLGIGQRFVGRASPRHVEGGVLLPPLVPLLDEEVDSGHARLLQSLWLVAGRPLAVAPRTAILIHVVRVGIERQT